VERYLACEAELEHKAKTRADKLSSNPGERSDGVLEYWSAAPFRIASREAVCGSAAELKFIHSRLAFYKRIIHSSADCVWQDSRRACPRSFRSMLKVGLASEAALHNRTVEATCEDRCTYSSKQRHTQNRFPNKLLQNVAGWRHHRTGMSISKQTFDTQPLRKR